MSAFVDYTLLRFAGDVFVSDFLTNTLGLPALFAAAFRSDDIAPQSFALGSVSPRAFKQPVFETVRGRGVNERISPSSERTQISRLWPRFGRLDWIDIGFEAVLQTRSQRLRGGLKSLSSSSLAEKIGPVASLAQLRAKLGALFSPSLVDDIFARLRIESVEDFNAKSGLVLDFAGAEPPAFDPADASAARDFSVSVRIRIADGFDVGAALQSAQLCRALVEGEAAQIAQDDVETVNPYVFVTLFSGGAVTDASLPGFTAAQAKAAVQSLFEAEKMFARFIT